MRKHQALLTFAAVVTASVLGTTSARAQGYGYVPGGGYYNGYGTVTSSTTVVAPAPVYVQRPVVVRSARRGATTGHRQSALLRWLPGRVFALRRLSRRLRWQPSLRRLQRRIRWLSPASLVIHFASDPNDEPYRQKHGGAALFIDQRRQGKVGIWNEPLRS